MSLKAVQKYVLLAHISVFATMGAAVALYWEVVPRTESETRVILFLFVACALWMYYSWVRLGGSLFDPYGLFILAATLFHGGQVGLEVVGSNPGPFLAGHFDDVVIARAVMFSGMCLLALHFGALISPIRIGGTGAKRCIPTEERQNSAMRLVGLVLVGLSLPAIIVTSREQVSIVIDSGYSGLYQAERQFGLAAITSRLSGFVVPGSLLLLASSAKNFLYRGISLIAIVFYALSLLILGIRGWSVLPLVAYGWVWHRLVRPFGHVHLVVGAMVVVLVLFPLVKVARSGEGHDRYSAASIAEAFTSLGNPAIEILAEFGYQLRTVAHTMQLVPRERPHDWGASYAYAATTAVPNLFWEIHPAKARGTPSDWLVETVEPVIARSGGGIGFSFIAEAYLNFGWYFSLPLMIVLGFGIARLTWFAGNTSRTLEVAAVGMLMSFILFYARSDMHVVFSSVAWYGLVPYVFVRQLARSAHPSASMLRFLNSRTRPE